TGYSDALAVDETTSRLYATLEDNSSFPLGDLSIIDTTDDTVAGTLAGSGRGDNVFVDSARGRVVTLNHRLLVYEDGALEQSIQVARIQRVSGIDPATGDAWILHYK